MDLKPTFIFLRWTHDKLVENMKVPFWRILTDNSRLKIIAMMVLLGVAAFRLYYK